MTDTTLIERDPHCVAGCQAFHGGERKHHKDCPFYAESLTKVFEDKIEAQQKRIDELTEALTEIYEYPSGQPIALGLSEEDWQHRRAEQMRFIARAALQTSTTEGG